MSEQAKTGTLLALGECMLELIPCNDDSFAKGYAGDTFNALVYAKRLEPGLNVSYLTGVGADAISQDMLNYWHSLGINSDKAIQSDTATIGIYAISTDEHGERSFSYWRKGSAASQLMQLADIEKLASLAKGSDVVFFSGIMLAILSDEDKERFIEMIALVKKQGARIAFDPNYRPKMWDGNAHAIYWLEKAYGISDILMPGIEEHEQLFGHQSEQDILAFCKLFRVKEVIIKCDQDGVYGYQENQLVHHQPFVPAPIQVDSTAAGDSFAGTYLAARISGDDVGKSIQKACLVAGQVVQHKGAIMPESEYLSKVVNDLAAI